MLARASDSSLMKLDQKNVAFQMHHCSLAALWGLPDWDDKLAILYDMFYPLSVCKALFLFFMGFFLFLQSRTEEKTKASNRLKVQTEYSKSWWNLISPVCFSRRTCLWGKPCDTLTLASAVCTDVLTVLVEYFPHQPPLKLQLICDIK